MRRKGIIATVIILVVVLIWLYVSVSRVIKSEQEVQLRFSEVVAYYVSTETEYVAPLLGHVELSPEDRGALEVIDQNLRDLRASTTVDDQFDKLLVTQKNVLKFISLSASYPEAFGADMRFQQWNKNSTNLGQASVVVRRYNEALSAYNARIASAVGKLAGYWKRWTHHQYLGIDGSLQDQPAITF